MDGNCFVQAMFVSDCFELAVSSREEKEMRLFTRLLGSAILTAGCYLSVPTVNVLAQSPPSAPDLSDQKLSATAAAMDRVVNIQKNYRQRLVEAEAPAQKERIVAEAKQELARAVTEQGLSVEGTH